VRRKADNSGRVSGVLGRKVPKSRFFCYNNKQGYVFLLNNFIPAIPGSQALHAVMPKRSGESHGNHWAMPGMVRSGDGQGAATHTADFSLGFAAAL
jgi:hypothetical protein